MLVAAVCRLIRMAVVVMRLLYPFSILFISFHPTLPLILLFSDFLVFTKYFPILLIFCKIIKMGSFCISFSLFIIKSGKKFKYRDAKIDGRDIFRASKNLCKLGINVWDYLLSYWGEEEMRRGRMLYPAF